MDNQGIYKISIGPKFYYGQSIDCNKRRRQHLNALKLEKHSNRYMQSAWNKYMDFSFEIIELVEDSSLLDTREQHYIDLHIDCANCMNLARCAEAPSRGLHHSDMAKAKISAARKGCKQTAEHVASRTKNASQSKQVKVTYPDGRVDIFPSTAATGRQFGITDGTVSRYCLGQRAQPGTGRKDKKTEHLYGYIFEYEQTPCH
jgi:hypothetical protein